jgi:hypothetical protein
MRLITYACRELMMVLVISHNTMNQLTRLTNCTWTSDCSIFRMDMVHLKGKGFGGRRVPLILTPDVVRAMCVLADTRQACHIPSTNVYFFATPSHNGYFSGWKVMEDVSKQACLQHPDLVHSTRLRKYVATVSQVCIH